MHKYTTKCKQALQHPHALYSLDLAMHKVGDRKVNDLHYPSPNPKHTFPYDLTTYIRDSGQRQNISERSDHERRS